MCKWKPSMFDSKAAERICAYANGKFNPIKSTIDAEIHVVINSLEALKIHYLDKKELIIRTDCQAIISFFGKTSTNKPSRVRWLAFTDYVTGTGIPISFEHIDGKDNQLADSLSRLINCLIISEWPEERMLNKLELITPTLQELSLKPSLEKQAQATRILTGLSALLKPINSYYNNLGTIQSHWQTTQESEDNFMNYSKELQCRPPMHFNSSASYIP